MEMSNKGSVFQPESFGSSKPPSVMTTSRTAVEGKRNVKNEPSHTDKINSVERQLHSRQYPGAQGSTTFGYMSCPPFAMIEMNHTYNYLTKTANVTPAHALQKTCPISDVSCPARFSEEPVSKLSSVNKAGIQTRPKDPHEIVSKLLSKKRDTNFKRSHESNKQDPENNRTSSVQKELIQMSFQNDCLTTFEKDACVTNATVSDETKLKSCGLLYTCGGCLEAFNSVCKLHNHLLSHGIGGSYRYIHTLKTAFPTYDTICTSTQTLKEDTIVSDNRNDKIQMDTSDIKVEVNVKEEEKSHPVKMHNSSSDTGRSTEFVTQHVYNCDTDDCDDFVEMDKNNLHVSDHCDQVSNIGIETRKPPSTRSEPEITSKQFKAEVKIAVMKGKHLRKRAKVKHDEKVRKKYICSICNKGYVTNLSFVLHQANKHKQETEPKPTKSYECKWCGETFIKRRFLLEHGHNCDKNYSIRCFICDTIQASKIKLTEHLGTHRNEQDLTCKLCDRQFSNELIMHTHVKRHKAPRNIQCEQCGKAFYHQNMLSKHLVHCSDKRTFKCSQCHLAFKTREALKHHTSVHTDERPYMCHICGHAAKKKMYLTRHIRSHTGERPYSCKVCGMRFSALNGLNRHNKVHTNVKTCVCSYCGKAFTNNWNLKTHERQHTGDTPYKCSHCGMGFKQNVLVKLHIRSHHPYIAQLDHNTDCIT